MIGWQDITLLLGSVIFTIALIPQLKDCMYRRAVVNVWSATLTAAILLIFCLSYASLSMWLAAIPLTTCMWSAIAYYSYKNSLLLPRKRVIKDL